MTERIIKKNCFSCARWDIKNIDENNIIIAHCAINNHIKSESQTCENHIFENEILEKIESGVIKCKQ